MSRPCGPSSRRCAASRTAGRWPSSTGPGGTQVPQRVIDAVTDYYTHTNANTGGAFVTSEASDAISDEAHAAVADLLGAASPDEIKFGYNMSTLTLHIGRQHRRDPATRATRSWSRRWTTRPTSAPGRRWPPIAA